MIRRLAAAAALVLCVAACSTPAPSHAAQVAAAPTSTAPAAAPSAELAATTAAPTRLAYPAIGVDADVEPTGLNRDGTVDVPDLDKAAEVDYLNWGPQVGAGRPLVFLSHVNGRDAAGRVIPGGFGRLHQAKAGDTVTVTGRSGARARYTVTDVRTVAKAQFPTGVYDPTPTPTLLLITCGGALDGHSYRDNVIARAELAA